MFDRSDDEWESIVTDTFEILKRQAQLRRVTSYSDVNAALARRGHRTFDFSNQNDRTAMGAVLGNVVKKTVGETRVMISAIVVYIDRNDAGPGFYNLAVQLRLLPHTATSDDKLAFWSNQVARVHELHARPKRQPRAN